MSFYSNFGRVTMDNGLLNCIFFVTVSGMNQSMIYQASKEDNGEISYIDEDINIDGGVVQCASG